MKWTEEWTFASFYKFRSILAFSCDVFGSFSWNKCGNYRVINQLLLFPENQTKITNPIVLLVYLWILWLHLCVFALGYHAPMYFYHTDEARQAGKTGKVAGLQRCLLSFRCQGAPDLRARVLTAGPLRAYFLFRDRIWAYAFRDRWREMDQGRECYSSSCYWCTAWPWESCFSLDLSFHVGELGIYEAWFINPWRSFGLQP